MWRTPFCTKNGDGYFISSSIKQPFLKGLSVYWSVHQYVLYIDNYYLPPNLNFEPRQLKQTNGGCVATTAQ